MSSIRETVLPSGLRVVTDPMDTVETVSIGVWVDAGTRHEPAPINGVSHMLEHMAFKGTQRRSAQDIAEEMDNVGGHLNAYTARDHTAYYAKILKDDTALAVDVISDILLHSAMDPVELEREQGVVIQEIGQSLDTPDDVVFDHFQSTAFPDQPLGRPVLGTEELVRAMDRNTILDYMRGQYSASSMVLSAAGKIDHDAVVDLALAAFGDLPDFARPKPQAALYQGGDFRESRDIEQVNLLVGFNGVAYEDPDYYAAQVLSTVLGGGMSSRLFERVREENGLAYFVRAGRVTGIDTGMFTFYAGTAPATADAVLTEIDAEIARVQAGEVTAEELQRCQTRLKAARRMGLQTNSARAMHAGLNALYGLPVDDAVAYDARIDAVTIADLQAFARQRFTRAQRVQLVVSPS